MATLDHELKTLPDHQAIILDNVTCVYCGAALMPEHTTKEHVVGRGFVPTGKLHQSWNLIVRACRPCNNAKSDLEDDIAAITMAPDPSGRHAVDDPALQTAAARKSAKSISRRTKKPVLESSERVRVEVPIFAGGLLTVDFTAPPQFDRERLFRLARLQLSAFFYWVTYDSESRRGHFWREGCYLVEYAIRSDWGNARLKGFADRVLKWEPRVVGITSDAFFKVIIRRHPDAMTLLWAWALEWNHQYRIVGFFGDRAVVDEINQALPPLQATVFKAPNGDHFRVRKNTPLTDEDDYLFAWDPTPSESGS